MKSYAFPFIDDALPRRTWLPRPRGSLRASGEIRKKNWLRFAVFGLISADLCFLPWAFGGVDNWALVSSAVLSGVALLLAWFGSVLRFEGEGILEVKRKLSDFFPFWVGLAFLLYCSIQALNPAFEYKHIGQIWWLVPLDHLHLLPSGLRISIWEMGPGRSILFWFSPWALMCATWLCGKSRWLAPALFRVIATNGALFAVFGILQRASGAAMIYGYRNVGFPTFVASLIYKNHAAIYFLLVACVAISVASDLALNRRRLGRGGPEVLFFFFALLASVCVILSWSVSGTSLMLMVVLAGGSAMLLQVRVSWGRRLKKLLILWSCLACAALGVVKIFATTSTEPKGKVFISADALHDLRLRWLADRQGIKMLEDQWVWGWGAGGFSYGFTKYQRDVPALQESRQLTVRWEHLHDDWLESFIELGVLGGGLIAAFVGFWVIELWRYSPLRQVTSIPILAGIAATALYAFFDFPLQNLAIACTLAALIPALFDSHRSQKTNLVKKPRLP